MIFLTICPAGHRDHKADAGLFFFFLNPHRYKTINVKISVIGSERVCLLIHFHFFLNDYCGAVGLEMKQFFFFMKS